MEVEISRRRFLQGTVALTVLGASGVSGSGLFKTSDARADSSEKEKEQRKQKRNEKGHLGENQRETEGNGRDTKAKKRMARKKGKEEVPLARNGKNKTTG